VSERDAVHTNTSAIRDLFAYTITLRRRVLAALADMPPGILERDVGANHRSILQTLIHIMVVQEAWLNEDILGRPFQNWGAFRRRYLPAGESLEAVRQGWDEITRQILGYLAGNPDLQRVVRVPGPSGAVTVEQILFHIVTEEMIHFGEILAMTRQLGIDLPAYFLMDVMEPPGNAWKRWAAEAEPGR
jgi:uncharacterized damage-inducible protein DinB